MKRDILKIDEELCNGCVCVPNCHEGVTSNRWQVRLVSELMCDGLGVRIGHCPEGVITIETREAEPYSETRVMEQAHNHSHNHGHEGGGCPDRGVIENQERQMTRYFSRPAIGTEAVACADASGKSSAPYFRGADLYWPPIVWHFLWVVSIVII